MIELKKINLYYLEIEPVPEKMALLYCLAKNMDTDPEYKKLNIESGFLERIMSKNNYTDINNYNSLFFSTKNDKELILKYFNHHELICKINLADTLIFENSIAINHLPKIFKSYVEQYILNRYTKNDVLDKMNRGLELTNIDKKILKSID